jgi:hypothetical protein
LALLSEVAYLAGSPDAETLNHTLTNKRPEVQSCCLFVASPRVRYAFTLKLRGEYQAAGLLVDAALTSAQSAAANGNELPRVRVNLAAIAAFKGLRTEVFESLEKAYSAGLRDTESSVRIHSFENIAPILALALSWVACKRRRPW